MYRYIEERNYAETWRDPDKVVRNNEKFFRTLKEAKDYAKKKYLLSFIQTERFNYAKFEKHNFKYNKDTKEWYFHCFGSWAPTIYIKRITYEK